jgi:hypothetical protein
MDHGWSEGLVLASVGGCGEIASGSVSCVFCSKAIKTVPPCTCFSQGFLSPFSS